MKYFIKTFGCAQNIADSERIASQFEARGMTRALSIYEANYIVVNTCMVRQMAEDRVYGFISNISKIKNSSRAKSRDQKSKIKIILTGCMVGMAARDKSGKFLTLLKKRIPIVDEFLPIEEVGFDHEPLRTDTVHAWVPISNGCNNFCTFCVVPFTRGREISRPYEDILRECDKLVKEGYKKITLLGMNVNSYGADLVAGAGNIQVLRDLKITYFSKAQNTTLCNSTKSGFKLLNGKLVKPILVKHLNRLRIPTLFPYLLEDVAKIEGIELVDFISSNPWDFSDELIGVIARCKNITRNIHLPVQSGSDSVLKRMNRWYTAEQYLNLIEKLKLKIENLKVSTDIIVGFCGETEDEFQQTVALCKKVGFYKAYIAMYSDRQQTCAHKAFKNDVPYQEKKRRWRILEEMINKPNFLKPPKAEQPNNPLD